MGVPLHLYWDAKTDSSRKFWHVYHSTSDNEKGTKVKTLDGDANSWTYPDAGERTHYFKVLAVNLQGIEEDWKRTRASGKVSVTRQENTPSAPANVGGGSTDTGAGLRIIADPPEQDDPPQRFEVIKGEDEYVGQLVGEIAIDRDGVTGEGAIRQPSPPLPALPGRGSGNGTQTYSVRGAGVQGKYGGSAGTFTAPFLDHPNHVPVFLASIVGATVTGFTAAQVTDGFVYSAGDGAMLRALPSFASATTANGWGTWDAGLLANQPYGQYHVNQAWVTMDEADLGVSMEFALECSDEANRKTAVGAVTSIGWGDFNYPYYPQDDEFASKERMGPIWASRMTTREGYPIRPLDPTQWQYRVGDVSPVTSAWLEYLPMVRTKARYVQAQFSLNDPVALHQVRSGRVYVRAHRPWYSARALGAILVQDGVTTQVIGSTPVTISGWELTGVTQGVAANTSTGTLIPAHAGEYEFQMACSFTGSANTTYDIHLNVGGAEQPEGFHRKIGTANDVGCAMFVAQKTLAAGVTCAVYVEANGAAKDFTLVEAQFTIKRI